MGASLLCSGALTSCGDQFQEEYPWMVGRQEDQSNEDESSAGRYDMDILERELKGAVHQMIAYAKSDLSWTPHSYQYQRANNIDNYCGYWTTSKGTFGFGGNLPSLYTYPNDYLGGPCDNSVFIQSRDAIFYAADMVDKDGNPVGSKPYWRAIALIIQSYVAQNVVNTYGACPLTHWRNNERNKTTQWEDGHEVYNKVFSDLDEAIATLKSTQPKKSELDKIEIDADKDMSICQGDWKLWVKFANCIRLRMAMNLSGKFDSEAKEQATKAINDEIGVLTESDARDIAYYVPSVTCTWYFISQTWGDIRLNANLENILKHFNNPLIEYWFDNLGATVKDKWTGVSTMGKIAGMRAGIDMMQKNAGSRTDGAYGSFSCMAQQHLPMPFFKVTESLFLQAEAALRWGIGSRTVKDLYEAGIRRSMKDAGTIGDDAITEYLNQTDLPVVNYVDFRDGQNNINGRVSCDVKWNESDSKELQLEKLITQKYIAVFPQCDAAWNDFRRTGYPRLFPPKQNGGMPGMDGKLELQIRRMPMPINTNNAQEMAGLSAVLGYDQSDASQPVFWDKGYAERQWGEPDESAGLPTPEPMPIPVNF